MVLRKQHWNISQLREQLSVIRGEIAPTILLKNATYLNTGLKQWNHANIWIYEDRIIYVGDQLPLNLKGTEVVDCDERYLVPGYIEPHVHPNQLYNPYTFMQFAAMTGTTTLICDNFGLFMLNNDEVAFEVIDELDKEPVSMYWWCRYDAQTPLHNDAIFSDQRIEKWLENPLVVQGGELTSWPQVLKGDNQILSWMQKTRSLGKPIEGHLPGASDKTLTQLTLLGVRCDHEAMTGEEAIQRMRLGLSTSLRYSSIRPDLPQILEDMLEAGTTHFDNVYVTTDGSTPAFHEQGVLDRAITIALEKGVSEIDAYMMASHNAAVHYNMEDLYGAIAPGRMAHINFLTSPKEPTPVSVLAKGQWVKRDGQATWPQSQFRYGKYLPKWKLSWELTKDMLALSGDVGIDMVNSVITKPFHIEDEMNLGELQEDIHYLSLIDKDGNWAVNTLVRGFADNISGFSSSYSNTGDIILIGKNHEDMIVAFEHMKAIGGGLTLVEDGQVIGELPLPLMGAMSDRPMEQLIKEDKRFREVLYDKGYKFEDPVYSLFFFSSTHLPYIRITQKGLVDVMKNDIVTPTHWF